MRFIGYDEEIKPIAYGDNKKEQQQRRMRE
jgi:hypothetical protein